jgi:hypothetical protein
MTIADPRPHHGRGSLARAAALLAALLPAAACQSTFGGTSQGLDMVGFFPFNGERRWTFENAQTDSETVVPYWLVSDKLEASELLDDDVTRVYTIEHTVKCVSNQGVCLEDEDDVEGPDIEGTTWRTWQLSANSFYGVRFHAVDGTVFDPPVEIARATMDVGESVTATANGTTFTSTYVGRVECPAPYWRGEDKPSCIELTVDDGGAGSGIAGTYWAVTQFGIVAFQDADDPASWQMKDFDFADQ